MSKSQERNEFAQFLVSYRSVNGYSQRDLAERMKISYTMVAQLESNKFDLPVSFFQKLWPLLSDNERSRVEMLFHKKISKYLTGELEYGNAKK